MIVVEPHMTYLLHTSSTSFFSRSISCCSACTSFKAAAHYVTYAKTSIRNHSIRSHTIVLSTLCLTACTGCFVECTIFTLIPLRANTDGLEEYAEWHWHKLCGCFKLVPSQQDDGDLSVDMAATNFAQVVQTILRQLIDTGCWSLLKINCTG